MSDISFPTLQTNRLMLVELAQNHLSDIYHLFASKEVTRYTNLLPLTCEAEAQPLLDWFKKQFEEGVGIRWGILPKGGGRVVGTLGFNTYTAHHRANIGYDLKAEYWGKGYMSEALDAVLDFGFNRLKINRIEAEVMLANAASQKLLSRLGFTNEGVLRQWMLWNEMHYDMYMFSLLKVEYDIRFEEL